MIGFIKLFFLSALKFSIFLPVFLLQWTVTKTNENDFAERFLWSLVRLGPDPWPWTKWWFFQNVSLKQTGHGPLKKNWKKKKKRDFSSGYFHGDLPNDVSPRHPNTEFPTRHVSLPLKTFRWSTAWREIYHHHHHHRFITLAIGGAQKPKHKSECLVAWGIIHSLHVSLGSRDVVVSKHIHWF